LEVDRREVFELVEFVEEIDGNSSQILFIIQKYA